MPLINIFTSAPPPSPQKAQALLQDLSKRLAQHLGKPEHYVMTSLVPQTQMTFGGTPEPTCLAQIRNVGALRPELTRKMSADLCPVLAEALGVAPDRIYIDFAGVEGHLWGYNGDTFG